ncbi:unnamed protein product [Paramecium primaurelia]|uniref:Uncharacterized protein n=1 Tax=Paramecium primaurelia TaxID=5886 RepID=A0A8S1NB22_PARPR|nr:unnamed protein product [Paramecium primaurelia]CAD8089818.1 unnamed protein product [Paramecium primaurelia]
MFDLEIQYLVQCSLPSQTRLYVLQLKRFVDGETLYIQNLQYQQEVNVLQIQNIQLRTIPQQLENHIQQIVKVDGFQLHTYPLGLTTANQEGSIVSMLKAKI